MSTSISGVKMEKGDSCLHFLKALQSVLCARIISGVRRYFLNLLSAFFGNITHVTLK